MNLLTFYQLNYLDARGIIFRFLRLYFLWKSAVHSHEFFTGARNSTETHEISRAQEILPKRKKFHGRKKFCRNARNSTETQEIQRRTYEDAIRKNARNLTATHVRHEKL